MKPCGGQEVRKYLLLLDQIMNEKEGYESEAYIWCFIREKFCKLLDSHGVLYIDIGYWRWLCVSLYNLPSTSGGLLLIGKICPHKNFIFESCRLEKEEKEINFARLLRPSGREGRKEGKQAASSCRQPASSTTPTTHRPAINQIILTTPKTTTVTTSRVRSMSTWH